MPPIFSYSIFIPTRTKSLQEVPQLQRNETSEFSLFGVNIHNLSLSFHCAVKGEHGERGDVGKKGDKGEIGDPGPQGEQARSDF